METWTYGGSIYESKLNFSLGAITFFSFHLRGLDQLCSYFRGVLDILE